MDSAWLGIAAGALAAIAFLAQPIKSIRTKRTNDVSMTTYVVLSITASLWVAYGFIRGDIILMAANGVLLSLKLMMVILKLKYDKPKKRMAI